MTAETSLQPEAEKIPAIHRQREKYPKDLFLDERLSLAGLFDLFRANFGLRPGGAYAPEGKAPNSTGNFDLGLVSFRVAPEYFALFKKPFRVTLSGPLPLSVPQPCYLLICETSYSGVIALDGEGTRRSVGRDFILAHWGGRVSSVYPYEESETCLSKGMNSTDVLEVQRVLDRIGYPVDPNGLFDEQTFREVVRFQRDFGLNEDGIVGRRTKALLFQMTSGNLGVEEFRD